MARERHSVDELHGLATRDTLTGAMNRRAFTASASEEILRAKRYPEPLSVAYLDVDGLKPINDQFGHDVGDTMLVAVADACRQVLRATDRFGRLGGDEFAILLPQTDEPAAAVVVERVQEHLRSNRITASFGIATFAQPPSDPYLLIQAADTCMYEAKQTHSGIESRHFKGTEAPHHLKRVADRQARQALDSRAAGDRPAS